MQNKFNKNLIDFFGCTDGACSEVTKNEYDKSQITFTGHEKLVAEQFFGAILKDRHGNINDIKQHGLNPNLQFRLHPTGREIELTVSYKTNKPTELRFYTRQGMFRPNAGEFWGIFVKNEEIWIFSMSKWLKLAINDLIITHNSRPEILDNDIDDYQIQANLLQPKMIVSHVKKWSRDPRVANEALESHRYICELQPDFEYFISKTTGKPYVEAHHLVPMSLQGRFESQSLDRLDNICVLSPLVHRKLHHGRFSDILSDIEKLIDVRKPLLDRLGLLDTDVLDMYL